MSRHLFTAREPIPAPFRDKVIHLAHGEGGRMMRRLLEEHVMPVLPREVRDSPAALDIGADAAVLGRLEGEIVFTTDSFIVSPWFFPGGDIGKLSVFGTVNDLAVSGARPRWISLSLIIEEGTLVCDLDTIIASVAAAAREADVTVVTGDTKVAPRGEIDGVFTNTAGIGELILPRIAGARQLQPGTELMVSGPIACHGMAVLAAREQLLSGSMPVSDCASLLPAVEALRAANVPVVAMRDATRGGVTAVLHEWASASRCTMAIEEARIPLLPEVRSMCELWGIDPLHVANEGTMLVAVAEGWGLQAVEALRGVEVSREAAVIGHVRQAGDSPVLVQRSLGRYVPLDEPAGAPLPRIC